MYYRSENSQRTYSPDFIAQCCQQILDSEPLIVRKSEEDEIIPYIGAWFDEHVEYFGNLSSMLHDDYCVITWETQTRR